MAESRCGMGGMLLVFRLISLICLLPEPHVFRPSLSISNRFLSSHSPFLLYEFRFVFINTSHMIHLFPTYASKLSFQNNTRVICVC